MSKRFEFFSALMARCGGVKLSEVYILAVLFERGAGVGMTIAELSLFTGYAYDRTKRVLYRLSFDGEVEIAGVVPGDKVKGSYLWVLTPAGLRRVRRDFYDDLKVK